MDKNRAWAKICIFCGFQKEGKAKTMFIKNNIFALKTT